MRSWRRWFKVATLIGLGLVGSFFALDRLFPPPMERYQALSPQVVDRDGQLLRAFLSSDESWRFRLDTNQVAPIYLSLLKTYEDQRFDRHIGVDPLAIVRALSQAITQGRIVSGASTLTMQTARLLEPHERDLPGKLWEAFRALQLELHYTKEEILGFYLTLAPYGGNIEGLRAASLYYFGKEPRHLTLSQAALLVVLPQGPQRFDPRRDPAMAQIARDRVVQRAYEEGVITQAQFADALQEPLGLVNQPLPFNAPHLSEELVATQAQTAPQEGLVIQTTLSGNLQRAAEGLLRETVQQLGPLHNGAVMIVNNRTMEVVAQLGSSDYFDRPRAGMIDLTQALRSPGSALKPFIYGLAFDQGLANPATRFDDQPLRYGAYMPRNYDRDFAGEVSLSEALQLSLNTPAVATLRALGPVNFDTHLQDVGVTLAFDRDRGDPDLPLALGGAGIRLGDLVRLYAGLANGGLVRELRFQPAAPEDDKVPQGQVLLSPGSAWQITRILQGAPRPLPAAGFPWRDAIAYKTGTSYGGRDAWALGYSEGFTIGVWIGRADGAPCEGCVGIISAAPLLFRLFDITEGEPQPALAGPPPEGTLVASWSLLPRSLQWLRPPGLRLRQDTTAPLSILFPVDGARFASPGDSLPAIPLRARGGEPPYQWIINGAPIDAMTNSERRDALWSPPEGGFHHLTLIDQNGASQSLDIFVALQ